MRLKTKFNITDRKKTAIASLSFSGIIIASSYLNEEITINIPSRLIYTLYAPKVSGVNDLRRRGCNSIGINWAKAVPEIKMALLRRISDFISLKKLNLKIRFMN
jgi:hypothetical protein